MRIFISWSGDLSRRIALVLRDWLPSVIQKVEPYVSSEDIEKGTRWFTDISQKLEDATFGLICLTPKNLTSPWILFESGALSKAINRSRVVPLLVNLRASDLRGPLAQFQAARISKDDIMRTLFAINRTLGEGALTDSALRNSHDKWWPDFDRAVNDAIEASSSTEQKVKQRSQKEEILEELLGLSRTTAQTLSHYESSTRKDLLGFTRSIKHTLKQFENSRRDEIGSIMEFLKRRAPSIRPAETLKENPFLESAYDVFSQYDLLTGRCRSARSLKEDLARFFWHYCFQDIVSSNHLRLFFESGSTLAFVARELLDSMRRIRSMEEFEKRFCISTNNVLVLFQIMFGSHIPFYLCPTGRPDDKYGATYGDIDRAKGPVPGCDEPVPEKDRNLVARMAEYVGSPPTAPGFAEDHRNTRLLLLAAASGMNCNGDEHLGPHVGSYRNKLFKRALLQVGVPVIFFLHAEKFHAEFIETHCYSVCGEGYSWKKACSEIPLAFCVAGQSIDERKGVLKLLRRFEALHYVSPEVPRGDYDHFPFLVANKLFVDAGVSRGLEQIR